jgi:hypothetical protein
MKPGHRSPNHILTLKGYSIRATWSALRRLSGAHFPMILPGVHPIASFFILRRLKRLGFSNCRIVSSEHGLVVHAHR